MTATAAFAKDRGTRTGHGYRHWKQDYIGWIWSGGQWYYCDPREGSGQGAMMTSTYTPDGYWVNSDGVWNP
ncbi:MAG: hypothetical protein HFG71_10290 [Hungatella sp.]|nr:hypothetical protein [Hungatella sp.]